MTGIFWVGKFGKYFLNLFFWLLDLGRDFWGYYKHSKICSSAFAAKFCKAQSKEVFLGVTSVVKMTTK